MKAWIVREKDEFCAAIVFAETRNQARVRAQSTDCCEDVAYTDIEAHRMKAADKYYREGKTELDWEDPDDRLVMVKDCGFTCDYDAFDAGDCDYCSAKEYCDRFKDWREENEG